MNTQATIVIEKGVPVTSHRPERVKYPFKDMEVGDSFEIKLVDPRPRKLSSLQTSLLGSAKAQIGGGKIITRLLPDRSGFRVWRKA